MARKMEYITGRQTRGQMIIFKHENINLESATGKACFCGRAGGKNGIGRSTLYNYENGLFSPTIDALEKIADALGVQIEELYEKEEKLYENEKE